MIYECIQDFYLDAYDEDGFLCVGKHIYVPKGSRWKIQESKILISILGNEDNIHLERIWKSKKTKRYQWIEITKEHLSEYFAPFDGKWYSVWWIDIDGEKYEKLVYAETPSKATYKAFKEMRDKDGVFEKYAKFRNFIKYYFDRCELNQKAGVE